MFLVSQPANGAYRHDKEDEKGRRSGPCEIGFVQALNLSSEQQEKLAQHRKQKKEAHKEIKQSLWQKRKMLKDALKDSNFDESWVRQLSSDINVLKNQLSDLKIDGFIFMRSVLTDEQYVSFVENIREGRGRPKRKGFLRKRGKPETKLLENP